MIKLKFGEYIFEQEKKSEAPPYYALQSCLGLPMTDDKEAAEIMNVPYLVPQKILGGRQIGISPVQLTPKVIDGKLVMAKIKIDPKQNKPYSYVYAKGRINPYAQDSYSSSIGPKELNDLIKIGLQAS